MKSHLKTCNSCGIILSDSVLVPYRKQLNKCKFCYKRYQAEQFKFWYENKKPKTVKVTRKCLVCDNIFETSWKIKNTCSRKCRAEHKKLISKERRKNEKNS